jgi:CxxC motif-containing protein (DUF1111 family)
VTSFANRLTWGLFALLLALVSCNEADENGLQAEEGEEFSGGQYLTAFDLSENAFGQEATGLDAQHQTDFVVGNSIFRSNWVIAPASVQSLDGLGPLMNSISCGGCHFKDGRAKPPLYPTDKLNGLLFRLSIPGESLHGAPLAEPAYGGQFQEKAIEGAIPEGEIEVYYEEITGTYADGLTYTIRRPRYEFKNFQFGDWHPGTMVSPRIAQQIPGLGLLENVEEETVLAFADENDSDGDGISGKPNYVWDESQQKVTLGRFGWKANQPSILQQTAGAFNGDMGITSYLFPVDGLTESQRETFAEIPNGGEPEIDEDRLMMVVRYIQALAVPARRNWKDEEVLRGKELFNMLNCGKCHVAKMVTSSNGSISVLNQQTIRPYTDLLLHDMGAGLADGRQDYLASGSEWRTAPLWGIGMIPTVNKHTYLLHDGRARNIEEAILWHGGEAESSVDEFKELSLSDRQSLIKFIGSL